MDFPLIRFLLIAILLGGGEYVAETHGLYWSIPWLDTPMHVIGGAFVAGAILFFVRRFSLRIQLILLGLGIIVVGVVWEMLELYLGITVMSDPGYWNDTIKDLAMDGIGSVAGYFLFKK